MPTFPAQQPTNEPTRPASSAGPSRPDAAADAPAASAEERREAELLAAARRGDRSALEALLLAVQPRIMAVCFRMSRDAATARDLCQDALVRVIGGLGEFSGNSRLGTWATRIAINVCLTDRRRQRLRTPGRTGEALRRAGAGPKLEPAADERVERGETLARLSEALASLSDEHRALLLLRDGQGLDYADIALVLGTPVGTIKSRLFRARAALRDAMERTDRSSGEQ